MMLKLKEFEGMEKSELSLIEVAKAILSTQGVGNVMKFQDLKNEIQDYLELSDEELRPLLAQFYTDLNIDGSFISLGENCWGLREWYPVDAIDEEISHMEDDSPRPKKGNKVNVFMDNDENAIDYSNDDPEDSDIDDDSLYSENEDDEISAYSKDLVDMDDEKDTNIEEDLTVVGHEHLENNDDYL